MEITTPKRSRRMRDRMVNFFSVVVTLGALLFIVPAFFGLERYVIAGESMQGTIDLGSLVFEEEVPVSELRTGDIITYVPPAGSGIENLVTHRIVSIKGDTFRTKGDNNPQVDPWTFQLTASTQPVHRFHVPYVGFAFLALQDRTFRILAIGVPAALIALRALVQLAGAVRGARRPGIARPVTVAISLPQPPPVPVAVPVVATVHPGRTR